MFFALVGYDEALFVKDCEIHISTPESLIQSGMKQLLSDLYDEVFAYDGVCEIRLNLGRNVWVQTRTRRVMLPRIVTHAMLENMLRVACDHSLYTAVDKMVQGFLPYRHGVRIGVGGRYSLREGHIHSLGDVCALVIRLAHVASGCSAVLPTPALLDADVLVVSPPGGGKTTFLRDLATRLSVHRAVVLVDERDEFAGGCTLDVGDCTVVRGSPKALVYRGVVRALSPQCVVFDEVMGAEDVRALHEIKRCGVAVMAAYHGRDLDALPPQLASGFDVLVRLTAIPTAGTVAEVRYG